MDNVCGIRTPTIYFGTTVKDAVMLPIPQPFIEPLTCYQPGKPIEELARELGLSSIIKLASNENPLGVSEAVKVALKEPQEWIYRYPDATGFLLKKALSKKFNLDPSYFTLGNGSNELLELIARAFVAIGEEIVFSKHAFIVYPMVTQAVGASAVEASALNWGHDLDAMARLVTAKTKLIFIANPNNPTGTYLSFPVLRRFVEGVPATVVIVVDEAYHEYVMQDDYASCVSLLDKHPNVVVTRTFSKAYGLAGLRVGFCISHPKIAESLNKLKQPFNVNGCALRAAGAALKDDAFILCSKEMNSKGLKQLCLAFKDMGLLFISSAGNFVCVDLGQPAEPIYTALLREGVIVRPLANYGMPNHLRVTVGTFGENKRFIESLYNVLQNQAGSKSGM